MKLGSPSLNFAEDVPSYWLGQAGDSVTTGDGRPIQAWLFCTGRSGRVGRPFEIGLLN